MRTLAVTLVIVTFLTGCQESPTGRNRLALVPDAVLADMGQQNFEQMKQQNALITRPDVNRLVQCITEALVVAAQTEYPEAPMPQSWVR